MHSLTCTIVVISAIVIYVERFYLCGGHLFLFIYILGTEESIYIRKEFNSHRVGLEQQHCHCFTVL